MLAVEIQPTERQEPYENAYKTSMLLLYMILLLKIVLTTSDGVFADISNYLTNPNPNPKWTSWATCSACVHLHVHALTKVTVHERTCIHLSCSNTCLVHVICSSLRRGSSNEYGQSADVDSMQYMLRYEELLSNVACCVLCVLFETAPYRLQDPKQASRFHQSESI